MDNSNVYPRGFLAFTLSVVIAWPMLLGGALPAWGGLYPLGETKEVSRLSDKVIPFKGPEDLPGRPRLLWEFGELLFVIQSKSRVLAV